MSSRNPWRRAGWVLLVLCAGSSGANGSAGDDIEEARRLYATGRYFECLEKAALGAVEEPREEEWHLLRVRSQLRVGDYDRARETVLAAIRELRTSLKLLLLAHDVLLRCGEPELAREALAELAKQERAHWRYRDAENMVVRGRARLLAGADAKEVMDGLYLPAKRDEPDILAPRIAIAELALAKHDERLAASEVEEALRLEPEEAYLHYLAARAFASSDTERATRSLARALELNPRHVEALLLVVDNQVAAEAYGEAAQGLERVLDVDSELWEAWAYQAVLAHLAGEFELELLYREKAFARWKTNPGVDHLIGRELSEKYRFAEGASYQRQALALEDEFLPARFQLAQDLLRLGEEAEGWSLADEVLEDDGYNVVAYNLMVLHDVLGGYRTLERDGFVVRMDPIEAEVYGERVLGLLKAARDELAARYEVELDSPIVVEIFAEQKDFAIRTFGLPGGHGFLGVCFGDVVTMQSPATPGKPLTSWEATLWHELCHAITLTKTRNRMPRWLSEGISVYEERLRESSWGQSMKPAYRQAILAGAATPLSQLSSAFLRPDGPLGLQFAYYESSLAVEHIVETYGFDALLAVLDELGEGVPINAALEHHFAPLAELDAGFDVYLRARARDFAPQATWETVEASQGDLESLLEVVKKHPSNLEALRLCAEALVAADRADEAIPLLERLLELCPAEPQADPLLARIYEELADTERELQVRLRWAARDADSLQARERLMELLEARADWETLIASAESALAIQPMLPQAHRRLARAARELGQPRAVIRAASALLALDPIDPVLAHYQIARATAELGDLEGAKREVLRALEEAPRFREAHVLLLELTDGKRGSL